MIMKRIQTDNVMNVMDGNSSFPGMKNTKRVFWSIKENILKYQREHSLTNE